ncbi:hypothetical protein HAX54_016481 [Datura stramonium]|uniref:FAF domain-containing protein n=1 Tax=Datura stramonium TaxID=4076 RepID=A0ABS8UIY9_DATST|nr:hypothetical protein [Datura stramonium]
MGSTSILYQGLQSCMEPQLPQQHVLINKLCPPRLTFSQSKFSTSSKKEDELQSPNVNAENKTCGWSFIKDLSNPKKDYVEKLGVYVHPLVKRSSTTLSTKSLEMCTESLGSETGSDIRESIEDNSLFLLESENSRLTPRSKCRGTGKKHNHQVANFPSPLTSMSRINGVQLRPHREGGRLILKATTISARKPCFKTERVDGRLRLSLLNDTETEAEAQDDEHEVNVDESDDGNRKLVSENGVGDYIRPSKCKENGSRTKGIPNWEPFWAAIS